MIMYHVNGYKIKKVEVSHIDLAHDKVVMIGGVKYSMTSTLNAYRGTKEEAEKVLIANMENRIRELERRLGQARCDLSKFLMGCE